MPFFSSPQTKKQKQPQTSLPTTPSTTCSAAPTRAEKGITLGPIDRTIADDGSVTYSLVEVEVDRDSRKARALISTARPLGALDSKLGFIG